MKTKSGAYAIEGNADIGYVVSIAQARYTLCPCCNKPFTLTAAVVFAQNLTAFDQAKAWGETGA